MKQLRHFLMPNAFKIFFCLVDLGEMVCNNVLRSHPLIKVSTIITLLGSRGVGKRILR
jgi:hypothetical protein